MLEAERTTLRDKLWVPVPGTAFHYSPLLGKVSNDVPMGPRGGFLCEEMGLGCALLLSMHS